MRTQMQIGAELDMVSPTELDSSLARVVQEDQRQRARSVKYLRFGPYVKPIVNSAFTLDGSTLGIGPREGFAWAIRRITVTGLATGASPDIANLFRNQAGGIPIWQFNGNNFAYTFSNAQLILLGGETLTLANVGAMTATGMATLSGDLVEVAAEELYKVI